MAFSFTPSDEVRKIRERIDHPIIDADGHLIEVIPLLIDFIREEAGPGIADRFQALVAQRDPRARNVGGSRVFWALPEENTLDRMTATLPELLYRRLDEFGVDFALLYPSMALPLMCLPDAEVRQAAVRACNRYYAEVFSGYRDRLEPVAVIPLFTPEEALAELDYAIGERGLKAIVANAVIPRLPGEGGRDKEWLDTVGFGSPYDYDPVWARCVELGVVPAFHGVGYGWGTRSSPDNYVYNHLGNFAAGQEAACRSLFMGGVPRRFPELRFAFLEGGVTWSAQLYADILGHFEKRNRDVVGSFDPCRFDLELCHELLDEFASGPIAHCRERYEKDAAHAKTLVEANFDDFSRSLITSPEDIVDVFTRQFYFGCEADDPMNAIGFDERLLPHGARMNAVFASDIGHWDVPEMRDVLPEAFELVEKGHIDAAAFRDFTCDNVIRMLTSMNSDFFEGTSVSEVARVQAQS